MAKFQADAALAAMTQRAHAILTGSRVQSMGLTAPAAMRMPAVPTYAPQNIRARIPAMAASLVGRFSNDALRINPHAAPPANLIAARQAAQQRDISLLGANDRYSSEAILAAARRNAPAGQTPHQVMQEGEHVDPATGQRYVMVKYMGPEGGNTIRVNL